MLAYPTDLNTTVSVVGIDPGSESLGFCDFKFDLLTFEIVSINPATFFGSRLNNDPWLTEIYGDRFARIKAHENNLLSLFEHIRPIAVVCESPFINMRRPQAYGALTEVIAAVRSAVLRYDYWKPLYSVDPSSAKRAVGAKGNADKQQVKAALSLMPHLVSALTVDLQALDEHSVDAIAIAYHQYLLYKNSTLPPA